MGETWNNIPVRNDTLQALKRERERLLKTQPAVCWDDVVKDLIAKRLPVKSANEERLMRLFSAINGRQVTENDF